MRSRIRSWAAGATTVVGRALAGVFFAIGSLRPHSAKALHPRGEIRLGLLRRQGCAVPTGVPWLDEPGEDDVLLRFSRSIGLPAPLPDVLGMALQVPLDGGGHGDLLLATTGSGRWGRYLLQLGRRRGRFFSSLFPYRAATGALSLAAVLIDEEADRYVLVCAPPRGPWTPFAQLQVAPASGGGQDGPVCFDPVLHVVPGLNSYGWATRLRGPAYAGSRRARGATPD